MLGDFAEKKETFLTIKKQTLSKSKKSHISKGFTHAFGQKTPIYSVFTIDQKKTRNNA